MSIHMFGARLLSAAIQKKDLVLHQDGAITAFRGCSNRAMSDALLRRKVLWNLHVHPDGVPRDAGCH
jgi:hypothetical protein